MTTTTNRMTSTRHPRRARTPDVTAAINADRHAARIARDAGNVPEAWRLVERTHILSQPWVRVHVRSHVDMLRLAVHARDRREMVGQILRMLLAGPGSAVGRYPVGNTGRSYVSATRPMAMPEDLAKLISSRLIRVHIAWILVDSLTSEQPNTPPFPLVAEHGPGARRPQRPPRTPGQRPPVSFSTDSPPTTCRAPPKLAGCNGTSPSSPQTLAYAAGKSHPVHVREPISCRQPNALVG